MAHLWVQSETGEWAVLSLDEQAMDLGSRPPKRLASGPRSGRPAIVLQPIAGRWALIAGPGVEVRVNGLRPVGGMRLLEDRDEVRADGMSIFYSEESLPRVEIFAAGSEPKFCPRCRQELVAETPAVRCPKCGIWHHQTEELPCWSYAETCALCPQPTELDDATFSWSPEEL